MRSKRSIRVYTKIINYLVIVIINNEKNHTS